MKAGFRKRIFKPIRGDILIPGKKFPGIRISAEFSGITVTASGFPEEEYAEAQKAENLIHRDFTSDAPNRKWLTDITQIPCRDGKLYIAPVLDCYNDEIVGTRYG